MVKIKKQKHLQTVSFDEEIITRDGAEHILSELEKNSKEGLNEIEENASIKNLENFEVCKNNNNKRKKKKAPKESKDTEVTQNSEEIKSKHKNKKLKTRNGSISHDNSSEGVNVLNEPFDKNEKKTKRKKKEVNDVESTEIPEQLEPEQEGEELNIENPKVKTGESIRAQKRKKHAKLLEDKRLKAEVSSQQHALNYLSKWKHCRNEWKFEKLKQIWLQQSLFDNSKIPDEFWETVVEYFSSSKGFIRKVILRDALKIIEKEENTEEENTDENYLLVLQRARDIVQHLQE